MTRPIRIAVVGAGPAGIYASDILTKSDQDVSIDLYDRMPAPFGLIRYGVAPDHPRIKGIVKSLHRVLENENIRFIGNVNVGETITVEELRPFYDAIIFATGATGDKDLKIPGHDLHGSVGAGEFVGFYDGNPNFTRDWNLEATSVAVIGVGNVALDIARMLSKTADELHVTEIPDNVYEGLKNNKATEVHVFGRRGPAQAKFTPLELKELNHSPNIQVIVDPEDIVYDEASENARRESKSVDLVCQTLEGYAMADPKEGAIHKLYLHFFESPTEILGKDGKVVGLKTERNELVGDGRVKGTGEFKTWDVQAVYRAVGYRSDAVEGIPFDDTRAVIPNDGGHVLDEDGTPIKGLYATGWIKRGPIGLIGNTKSDAKDTTGMLLEDWNNGVLNEATQPDPQAPIDFILSRDIAYTTWDGWHRLDAAEHAAGEAEGRERKKIIEWEEMVSHARYDAES